MADNTKKKKEEPVEEGLPIWMATFADMMTLLFAFFVLLFSMATIDPVKVSAMEDAMNENAVQNAAGAAASEAKGRELKYVVSSQQYEGSCLVYTGLHHQKFKVL